MRPASLPALPLLLVRDMRCSCNYRPFAAAIVTTFTFQPSSFIGYPGMRGYPLRQTTDPKSRFQSSISWGFGYLGPAYAVPLDNYTLLR